MLISLFDAFTVAPMLSAYLATGNEHKKGTGIVSRMLLAFDRFQTRLENRYEQILRWATVKRKTVLVSALSLFVASLVLSKFISKTFIPANDFGEFSVTLELPVGTSLEATHLFAKKIEGIVKTQPGSGGNDRWFHDI